MKNRNSLFLAAVSAVLLIGALHLSAGVPVTEETTTDPVGFVTVPCPAGSDTRISVILHLPPEFRGALSADPVITGAVGAEVAKLVPNGTPVWTMNQFAGTHYVRFTLGARNGFYYDVTTNETGDLTIDLNGDGTPGIVQGDTFKLVPHWTLDTLFPPGEQTTFHGSLGDDIGGRLSELLIPDIMGAGINNPVATVLFLSILTGIDGGWRQETPPSGAVAAGDYIIRPDLPMIVRNPAGQADREYVPIGHVETGDVVIPLATQSGASQDTSLGLIRPVPVELNDLGLDAAVFTASLGTDTGGRQDELLVFNNGVAALNKPADKIYFKDLVDGFWKLDGGGATDRGMEEVPAGASFVIRKVGADGLDKPWLNPPNY